MNKLIELLYKYATPKRTILFAVLGAVNFVVMVFGIIPKITQGTNGMKVLDLMPQGYDLEYVNTLFKAIGQKGRDLYLYTQMPLDMLFPWLFGISYCLIIALILKKLGKLKSNFALLSLFPFTETITDHSENFGIINLLKSYPNITAEQVGITNTMSLIKTTCIALNFIIILCLIVWLIIETQRRKKTAL